jgi:hypothetical protein
MTRVRRASSFAAAVVLAGSLAATTDASATCGQTWSVSEEGPAEWRDVAIADSTHAWAVGFDGDTGEHLAIASWDGSTWQDDTPTLFASNSDSHLASVWAAGTNDVWAVGDYYDPVTQTLYGLILHRDATGWSVDRTVEPGRYPRFESVWGDGSGSVWAVGETKAGGRFVGITYHRVGGDWVRVPFPRADGVERFLHGVSGSGPNDVWTVGDEAGPAGGATSTIAYHWTGAAWDAVPLPTLPHPELTASLFDVTAPDAQHAWAVGYFAIGRRMLLERWDGHGWQRVYIPDQVGREDLRGVAATSATNAIAVGYQDLYTPIARTWDGHRWSAGGTVPIDRAQLTDVAMMSGVGTFAVGTHAYGFIATTCA